MDERHWWIAGKIQESFQIGGYENPALLEEFMCEDSTLTHINQFLKAGGPCRLFFYCEPAPESDTLTTDQLHITGTLASLRDISLDNVNIVYFLRKRVDKDVDPNKMEKDVFCGELKHNTIETLTALLSDIYIPLLKAQKDWGHCNDDSQAGLMHSMDKFLTAFNESSASMHSSKQFMLKQPKSTVMTDFKQQRAAALDPQLIGEYEELASSWISTIEAILTDTSDERFMDPNAGPLSELERWRRRQRLLISVTEQLKTKECKIVIGVLITAKSRLLKKWKTVDSCITDGMNETKDKVKYLESLRRHFDQLYSFASPASIMNSALPGLFNSMKQMDSISRFYSRTGFLGLLLTKVSNQLVLACKEYIKSSTITPEDEDQLWDCVATEIKHRDSLAVVVVDPLHKVLRNQVESKLKGSRAKTKDGGVDEGLYGRLKSCLILQGHFRESVRSLRDALTVSQNLSHYPSVSSVAGPGSFTARSKLGGGTMSNRLTATSSSLSTKKGSSIMGSDHIGHGVPLSDEEAIMSHMDVFCTRIRQIMDVINTLSQYTKMAKSADMLPRPRKEDLSMDEEEEDRFPVKNKLPDIPKIESELYDDEDSDSHVAIRVRGPDTGNLVAIAEGEEVDDGALEILHTDLTRSDHADEIHEVINIRRGLSMDELDYLRKYYHEDEEEEGPSISFVVCQHLEQLTKSMSDYVTTKTMLDVESKDKDRYEDHYGNFLHIVQDMERFLGAYLHAVFGKKMKTQHGLNIITRFTPIQTRQGIRATISEKFVEIFNWYESDLEDVQRIYEADKDHPQVMRNAPPVAGAIHWSRQLLQRIEDPMKIFRDNKAINQLGDFGRIVRIYNRLATALVTFESLWYTHWKNNIEQAKTGLKATLLVLHPKTGDIVVNSDDRILELIQESKWLTRLGIQIPESASSVMMQEGRFKNYKSHLQLCLEDYKFVCKQISDPLQGLFSPHIENVRQQLHPGLNTLAWNSMNIDAFLHQVHTTTHRLGKLGQRVADIMKVKVDNVLETIENFYLYDSEAAFSKSWPPELFRDTMVESVKLRSRLLKEYVTTVQEGLQSVISILTNRKECETQTLFGIMKAKNMAKNLKQRKRNEPGAKYKDNKLSIFIDDDEEKEKEREAKEEGDIEDLCVFYRTKLHESILNATSKSLLTLAEACGCDGEFMRAMSVMSCLSSDLDTPRSRLGSANSDRPHSSLSTVSNMTWTTEKTLGETALQFQVEVKFSIPKIIVHPALPVAQKAISDVANAMLNSLTGLAWIGLPVELSFHKEIVEHENIEELMSQLTNVVEELKTTVDQHLFHFSYYDFLWKDDMQGNYEEFIGADPGIFAIKREVERLLYIEKKVLAIPKVLPVGPICLNTDPIKDALHGFAMAWKTKYASVLHEEAKRQLDAAIQYRHNIQNKLDLNIQTLDQLNGALHLLEELRDMENKIDSIYLPIETMYAKLREFELRLPREEVEEVDKLRDKWQELLDLADQVSVVLLKERRGAFEQELDKQVKTFVVEVIQFRNAFDAQGPAVPGIPPAEAVSRLYDFQHRYTQYHSKRKTLDSVSKLFGIICKPFPELDKTGEELDLLSQVYGLFQKFIRFDTQFCDTLWAEIDLEIASQEVESYWDECLALPSKLKDWDAYHDLKTKLQIYLEVFPLLQSLASKEIRNRHWLQVMHVTGSVFQLEANVFKLFHLLDIGLIKHKPEIQEICMCANRELELEVKMRLTEEEWTEQVLTFEHYKRRGPIYLDKSFTQRLLEQLEDAQALLASMLTSRYIGPLRDEAASWAEKLKEVAEVLEMWLEVQDLWQYLEAVFSNSTTAKDLPQEAKRFARIDKGWIKMMKRAFDTKNVLQSCYGGEVPKAVVLRHILEELEICFRSLVVYLNSKRRAFPRFYFVSDPVLLAMLSRPTDLDSVRPHLRSIFSSIHDVKLERIPTDDVDEVYTKTTGRLSVGSRNSMASPMGILPLVMTPTTKTDKRLALHYTNENDASGDKSPKKRNSRKSGSTINPSSTSHMLPSEGIVEDVVMMDAISISSSDGEYVILQEKVTLTDGVESWLQKLRVSVAKTIKDMLVNIMQDCNNGVLTEEWAAKYPAQVCRVGMLYYWTKECDQGIADIKYERKALQGTLKKFVAMCSRLPAVITRGAWRTIDDVMLPVHKARLESMLTQSLFLRDILDNMCNRKLRESTDFEWRRSIRCYCQTIEEKLEPQIYILDAPYAYGNEYLGLDAGVALTPMTERCLLTMSHAIQQGQGCTVSGPVGVGKTETVKGLANIVGIFLGIFQCSSQSDPTALGKICQGLAMDGCWGCFDEAHNLSREAISVLVDHVQAIFNALRTKQTYAIISDIQEILVRRTVALFLTVDPSASPPSFSLPADVKALFRTVSIIKPDFSLVLKSKCSALGFKGSAILGSRLKMVTELARDQLPAQVHNHFSLGSLTSALHKAVQKRKFIREEKTQDKLQREDTSRSESQASEAPTRNLTVSQPSMTATSTGKLNTIQRKAGTPNPLSAIAKMEHALVCQSLEEMIVPRLDAESIPIFKTILKDMFSGLPDPPMSVQVASAKSTKSRSLDIDIALEKNAVNAHLIPHKPWIVKCIQLYALSLVHNGIIVAGPPGSGKSSCIQTLVEALSANPRGLSRQSISSRLSSASDNVHKLQKINPLVVDDCSLMFGYLNQNHDWVDGIFTSAYRKANRNQSTTWLCLDGPLNAGWADNFNSLMDKEKVLHLKNGDKLFMSDNVKILFETDNLNTASPATVARSGIVFLDKDVVGWRPIARAWLENRTHHEIHSEDDLEPGSPEAVLQRSFEKTVDPISYFVLHEAKPHLKLSEVGMFKTCLGLLSTMLADNVEIGGELHVERLYIFCLIWTFGGLLDKTDRKAFSDKLKALSTALPDDDRDICVFDYYVDESGEWDPWHSRVPEAVYTDNQDMLGEVFVDTVDTIRTRLLMDFAVSSGQNVLLVGPHGCGKTTIINDFIDVQDSQLNVCKRLVFSGASTAKQLHQFIESNIYHRQGFVYGGKENKKLQVFIDDVNLPVADEYGVQKCNELLRQLVDDKVVCTLQKPFELKTIEGLLIMSAMAMSTYPGVSNQMVSERLLRHFAVFSLPAPHDDSLKTVVNGILESNMMMHEAASLETTLHNSLVEASCRMLSAVQDVLRPTALPGRHHYLFTLKDLTKCFQCLKRLPDESRADESMVVSLWKHEIHRIMRDRICRTSDLNWFDETLDAAMKEKWSDLEGPSFEYFITFPTETRGYQRPVTTIGHKHMKVLLQPVENLQDLHSCLNAHLTRYNEEFGNVQLDIMLSDYIISNIVRMHRVLSFHHSGNLLLIGSVGSHLATLCKLALHVADIPIHAVDTTTQNNFLDGLRSAVRLSGAEGKILTLMFTAVDLVDTLYLDAINSLLISGEYPHLFTNDEMDGLLQAIGPAMKREYPSMSVDPTKFFVSRVKSNLHIIICLPPKHTLLRLAPSQYPGLLAGCEVNWMCDWPQESLLGEAQYYITKCQLTQEFEDLSSNVNLCLANIHSFVLRDTKAMPWAGDMSPEITLSTIKVQEKKKDQLKVQPVKVPNLPYTKTILQERISLRHRAMNVHSKNEVYVGPTSYRRLMDCFNHLYSTKAKERTETVEQLKKVLSTLDQTRSDAKVMKKAIKSTAGKYENAKMRTADLMHKLTARATILEKLKAKLGLSTSLDAYLQLNELEVDDNEDDELLKQEEYDEYDVEFDRMREATLKSRQVQAKEEFIQAVKTVEDSRKKLQYAREQVIHWRTKVDRQCIEQMKAFSSPPILVGQVLEMIIILIGKKLQFPRTEQPSRLEDPYSNREEYKSNASSSTKMVVKKEDVTAKTNKETSDRVDRAQWKSMQSTMNDAVKFVGMLHNLPWEDGLPNEVLNAVESYLARGRDGQLGVTGEGTMLENAAEKTFQATKRSPSPDGRGITIAAAKYSSESCSILVQYTIALVEYSRLCDPLKASMEKQQELQREIEENEKMQKEQEEERKAREDRVKPKDDGSLEGNLEQEREYTEEDFSLIQSQVDELQQQFDRAVVEKHSLELELSSMNERLKAATEMVESLKSQELEWRQYVKENDGNELLLANCISTAAFLTYCGPLNTDIRKRMGEFFMTVCEHHGLPLHSKQLSKNIELIDFLTSPLEKMNLEILGLPTTKLMLENTCFLTQDTSMTAWPLICDPTSRVLDWLKFYYKNKGLVEVKYSELRSQLENCLADGSALMVTDCDVEILTKDARFTSVIQSCSRFIQGKSPFKVIVEDHEVECDPRFRLFLHTTTEPHMVPLYLAAYTSVLFYQQSRNCIEEELLDRFMAKEKSRLEDERTALREEKLENMELLNKLEQQMLENLSCDVRLMNDLHEAKKLAELKKQYEETVESQSRVEGNEATIMKAREGFRIIAQRAAVCFDTSQYMRDVNPLYQTSFKQFLDVYDAAINHSERLAVKAVLEKLTYSSYVTTSRALIEKDRIIFGLLLGTEVEESNQHIGIGEREFVISPNYSAVVMAALGNTAATDSKILQAKKPFDWMTDDQFHNLQVLATHFEWFQEMFDRMPKDGRETQWRNLCESDQPESIPLPDRMDDMFKPMQRLCILRAIRSDRIMQAASLFITTVLGKKYFGDVPIDLPVMLRQSSPTIPIILLFTIETDTAAKVFQDFASRKQSKTLVLTLTDNGPMAEKTARKYIQKGMTEGFWVLLHNAHNAPHLLECLEAMLLEHPQPDTQFRCWISAQTQPECLPVRLLQKSVKAVIDSPKVVKDSLVRAFTWFEPDILKQTSRPEWPAVLHNICYLHSAIQLRARYGRGGWNSPTDFLNIGSTELYESLSLAINEFKDILMSAAPDGTMIPRVTSWTGLRYMLAECVYGRYATDPYDQLTLGAIVDYWISPTAVKKDFEVARLKYRMPAAFFNPHVRLSSLVQSLEGIPNYFLEVPEGCHLHPNVETLLGDDQYIFTRLNKVFDNMPSSETLSHKLFPRPPTPFDGPPLSGISPQSNNPAISGLGVFSSASYTALKIRKDVELWEICHTMLPKVPKAYTKDQITERLKKIGGATVFNNYIIKELDTMYKLLTEIKSTLQTLKAATESNALGDQISEHILSAADDLYHLRIPQIWCQMAGNSAPPLTWGLGTWLADLQNRCHHFEKILVLGRDKMPAYWLGAFFNPRGLLAMVKQECMRQYSGERSGNFEMFSFQTEVTSRDKDHLRDPPQEGMFVYGIYVWGCTWEKTTGELHDSPPRHGCAPLPVVHVTCWPTADKPIMQDSTRASETYPCPIYPSRIAPREPIMEMDVRRENIPATRWALRSLSATIRPY